VAEDALGSKFSIYPGICTTRQSGPCKHEWRLFRWSVPPTALGSQVLDLPRTPRVRSARESEILPAPVGQTDRRMTTYRAGGWQGPSVAHEATNLDERWSQRLRSTPRGVSWFSTGACDPPRSSRRSRTKGNATLPLEERSPPSSVLATSAHILSVVLRPALAALVTPRSNAACSPRCLRRFPRTGLPSSSLTTCPWTFLKRRPQVRTLLGSLELLGFVT